MALEKDPDDRELIAALPAFRLDVVGVGLNTYAKIERRFGAFQVEKTMRFTTSLVSGTPVGNVPAPAIGIVEDRLLPTVVPGTRRP